MRQRRRSWATQRIKMSHKSRRRVFAPAGRVVQRASGKRRATRGARRVVVVSRWRRCFANNAHFLSDVTCSEATAVCGGDGDGCVQARARSLAYISFARSLEHARALLSSLRFMLLEIGTFLPLF